MASPTSTPGFYSLSCETYSGTRRLRPTRPPPPSFLFAVVRDVQRNEATFKAATGHLLFLFAVVRDVQRNSHALMESSETQPANCFYSLSCETYSGTRAFLAALNQRNEVVSIRCRARRTAERLATGAGISHRKSCLYSLSCETYSGTGSTLRPSRTTPSFYSLSCETYSGTGRPSTVCRPTCSGFLFAVVRDVQRNAARGKPWSRSRKRFYSLSCETYSGTAPYICDAAGAIEFLFAVVRDVQRNYDKLYPYGVRIESFYSLSCETYSGTCPACGATVRSITRFLFAVVRDVQRNCSF